MATRPALEDVKASLLSDHAAIRDQLVVLDRLALEQAEGAPGTSERSLTDAIWSLFIAFDKHLAREERDLFPYVQEIEGQGRVEELREEHRQQRTVLLAMVNACDGGETRAERLGQDARWLAASLRRDIHEEEREFQSLSVVGYVSDQATG